MKRVLLAALAATLPLPATATATASVHTFGVEDLPTIAQVADVAISPDGKRVVYRVGHANMKDDRYESALVLYDVASRTHRTITVDRNGVHSPQWSPDGTHLAFLAPRGKEKERHQQLFILDLQGGDASPITDGKQDVQQFAWRPDSKALAYVREDENPRQKEIDKHLDAFVVGDQAYLERSAPMASHLWLVDADGAHDRRLTSGTWSIPQAAPPSSPGPPISWSPDGTKVLFTRAETPYSGDWERTTLQVLNVASGAITAVTGRKAYEGFGEFSPDGSHIAYWFPHDGNPAQENDVFVTGTSGEGIDISGGADVDTNVQRAIWLPDGKGLLLSGHRGTDAALWVKLLDGSPARRVALGDVQPIQNFWLDASMSRTGALAFVASVANHPVEVYYLASLDAKPVQLSTENARFDRTPFGTAQSIAWKNDGFDEDGVITLPPQYDPSRSYPLVLVIHGGPNSASLRNFSAFNQILASRGYIVFNPNYRGSDNLGARYWYGIWNDAGAGPGRDVMAGVAAVEKAYKIDASRIAVSGWSYGGYMTSWLEGHYHIWKTAVAGAAVNNWVDEYALSDNNVGVRFGFNGSPYVRDTMKAYREQSPLTYAWNITTPTLILSDTGDARVPITESYEMFRALRDRGTPVKFFAYPINGHFPSDPVRSQDVYRRWADWIERAFKD